MRAPRLQIGLQLEAKLGVNPYKFGMIGSTDSHTSLATAEEDNFFGKHSGAEPSPDRATHEFMRNGDVFLMGWQMVASGYAGVWATENTREALWDAMRRKEVYATTGPRMLVRFFGGWDFTEADAQPRSPAFAGYGKGVPMGGDLRAAPDGKAPTFLVAALKDPIGGNLDRIQIVKGWVDAGGARQEKVYDVVWSGDRAPGADGKLPPVGNTVDVANATWTNTIGASELIAVWTDPDFDPALRAVYYARVIEIPTPRWTAYDADALRRQDAARGADVRAGARLHVADLVHAGLTGGHDEASARTAPAFPRARRASSSACSTWPAPATSAAPGEIVVSAGQIASMEAIFSRTWQRPPTAEEIEALVDDYIRDEVLYREARRHGPRPGRRGRPPPPAAEDGVRRRSDSPTPSRPTPS